MWGAARSATRCAPACRAAGHQGFCVAEFLQNELSKISLEHKCNKVEFGALIITTGAKYFMSIGLGKVSLHLDSALSKDSAFFYAISGGSPIGKVLQNATGGDLIKFNGREIEILHVE